MLITSPSADETSLFVDGDAAMDVDSENCIHFLTNHTLLSALDVDNDADSAETPQSPSLGLQDFDNTTSLYRQSSPYREIGVALLKEISVAYGMAAAGTESGLLEWPDSHSQIQYVLPCIDDETPAFDHWIEGS